MKITRRQLRQIILEAVNPGSAFKAASKQGAESRSKKEREKLTSEVQKTVDFFNNVVLPDLRSGESLNIKVPQDLVYSGSERDGYRCLAGGQIIKSTALSNQELISKYIKLNSEGKKVSEEVEPQKRNLGHFYGELETFVINNELSVTMVSDVSDELDKKEKVS